MPKAIFNIQSFKGKVWIGIKEQLLIQVEGNLVIGKSFTTMFHELNLHEVNTFGDYNIELDEGIFAPRMLYGIDTQRYSSIYPFRG